MKVIELLKKYEKYTTPIFQNFIDIHPDDEQYIGEYVDVYYHLVKKNPKQLKRNFTIFIEDINGEEYDLYGINGKVDNENNLQRYALQFQPWAYWLSFDIDSSSFKTFSELDAIGVILYDMTSFGFTESDIHKNKQKVKDMLNKKKKLLV